MPEQTNLSNKMDLATRAVGVGLLMSYGAGFIIVSLRHGALGIAEYDFFKPRLVAAGILFTFFVAISVLAAAKTFGFFSFATSFVPRDNPSHSKFHILISRILLLLTSCFVVGIMTLIFFKVGRSHFVTFKYYWLFVGFGGNSICLLLIKFWALEKRFASLGLNALGFTVSIISLQKLKDSDLQLCIYWLFAVGLIFSWLAKQFPEIKRFEGVHAELFFVTLIFLAASFAIFIYPRIDFGLGGGLAPPMRIQFNGSPPLDRKIRSKGGT